MVDKSQTRTSGKPCQWVSGVGPPRSLRPRTPHNVSGDPHEPATRRLHGRCVFVEAQRDEARLFAIAPICTLRPSAAQPSARHSDTPSNASGLIAAARLARNSGITSLLE